jgi:murein DD-endopeptidase MepM/ murein hydrolase activator NlpD
MHKLYSIAFCFLCVILPSPAQGFLDSPVQGTYLKDYFIINYMDQDSIAGRARDPFCGSKAYEGNTGIDFVIKDYKQIDEGVKVLAAAPGYVFKVVDTEFDRNTTSNPALGFGNYIGISHLYNGKLYYTYYAHLKKNSHKVDSGMIVTAGQVIAEVACSGNCITPHLHFEVWTDSSVMDPFLGNCTLNTSIGSLWRSQLSYDANFGVIQSGLSNTALTYGALRERPTHVSTYTFPQDSTITFWAEYKGVRTGDSLVAEWYTPSGQLWYRYGTKADADYWLGWWWSIIYHPALYNGESGLWNVKLLRNGVVEKVQAFTTKVTIPPFLSSPIAGNYLKDYIITSYVDQDLTLGAARDPFCGNKVTDASYGTDFMIKDYKQIDEGVNVLAVAPGTVFVVVDSLPDRNTVSDGTQSFGNYIGVQHTIMGKNFYSYYAHIKKNSRKVSVGTVVTEGQPLGQVACSGDCSAPKLHFELWSDSSVVDPFVGNCSYASSTGSLWKSQPAYDTSFSILQSGMNEHAITYAAIRERPSMTLDFKFPQDSTITFWVEAKGIRIGDSLVAEWYSPSGALWYRFGTQSDADYWVGWWWSVIYHPELYKGESGLWTVKFLHNGVVEKSQTFTVRTVTGIQPFLDTPIEGQYLKDYYIVNYVDQDTLLGVARDPYCGTKTYDGNYGTDFVIKDYKQIDEGVNVVAAAPGVVFKVIDTLADRSKTSDGTYNFGNYIGIRHSINGTNYYTYYAHLKKNSHSVDSGMTVTAGRVLAQVACSGDCLAPNLHFEVWSDTSVLDPFHGPCSFNQSGATLWKSPLLYDSTFGIIQHGLSDKPALYNTLRERPDLVTEYQYPRDTTVTFWLESKGVRTNDSLVAEWYTPSGTLWYRYGTKSDGDYWLSWWWSVIYHPAKFQGNDGEWTVRFYRNGTLERSQAFTTRTVSGVHGDERSDSEPTVIITHIANRIFMSSEEPGFSAARVELYDLLGRNIAADVTSPNESTKSILLPDNSQGLYLLKVTGATGVRTYSIMLH